MTVSLNPREAWGVVLWISYPLLIGTIAGICMLYADWRPWYCSLRRAPWSPAGWVFNLVWPILYCAMAVVGVLVYVEGNPGDPVMHAALAFHFAQIIFNGLWTPVFFFGHRIQLAFVILVLTLVSSITATILAAIVYPWTLFLYLPYVAWLLFALALNCFIVRYNDVGIHDKWFDVRPEDNYTKKPNNDTGESLVADEAGASGGSSTL